VQPGSYVPPTTQREKRLYIVRVAIAQIVGLAAATVIISAAGHADRVHGEDACAEQGMAFSELVHESKQLHAHEVVCSTPGIPPEEHTYPIEAAPIYLGLPFAIGAYIAGAAGVWALWGLVARRRERATE